MHGTAPHDLTVSEAVQKYSEYLVLNRRERTRTRYRRVLDTFAFCFLQRYHPDIERLRDIKPLHVEDYKRRRSAGEISEPKTAADDAREQQRRSELAPQSETAHDEGQREVWMAREAHRSFTRLGPHDQLRTAYPVHVLPLGDQKEFFVCESGGEHREVPRAEAVAASIHDI